MNRRLALQMLAQASGALLLASCGSGFAARGLVAKAGGTAGDLNPKTPASTLENPYGTCAAGDVYGYGTFQDAYGYDYYGQGPCDTSLEAYGYGYGYGHDLNPKQAMLDSVTNYGTEPLKTVTGQSKLNLSFFERLTNTKRG